MTAPELAPLLRSYRIRFGTEKDLQDDVSEILTLHGVPFVRESPLGKDRIDFLAGSVGIECKVEGGPSAVLEQLVRYAAFPEVEALILVSSRKGHRFSSVTVNGKPLYVVWVAGNL